MEKLLELFRNPEWRKRWFRKAGIVAFMFFLLKGIGWLLLGYFILR